MSGPCLDEETVLAFLDGKLLPDARTGVEAHLSSCASCTEVTTWAAAELVAPTRTPGREGRPFLGQLLPGAFVDRYQILGPVGRGGMGEVYAAYHPDLDRRVAIKIVFETGADAAERRSRLLREARAIARLSHSNVVTVHDAGTFADRVYIAMEFVDGGTLNQWLRHHPPRSWSEILEVFLAAGRGLAAAHAAGIVHRDFKPQNVMIGRDGLVRVTDFGLARMVFGESADAGGGQAVSAPGALHAGVGATGAITRMTKTGALIGTPAYMAPEQFRGAAADARSDQFSFCVSLYEALYGERPLARPHGPDAADARGPGGAAMTSTPGAPAASRVPLWLRKAVMRGLSPEPENRWPSLHALLEALATNRASPRKWWAVASATALLAMAALLAVRPLAARGPKVCAGGPEMLTGVWDSPAPRAPEPPRHASIRQAFLGTGKSYAPEVLATVKSALTRYAQSWADMYRETCEATHVRGDQSAEVLDLRMSCLKERLGGLRALTDVFADATGEVVANAVTGTSSLASLDRCADVALLRAVVQPPEGAEARKQVESLRAKLVTAKASLDAGRWRETVAGMALLLAEAKRLGYQPLMAEALSLQGWISIQTAAPEEAKKMLSAAFWLADESKDDEVRAGAGEKLVFVTGYQEGRFAEAELWAATTRSVIQRLGGHDLLRAWLLNDLSGVQFLRADTESSIRVVREAIALKQRILGPDDPDVGLSEGNLALYLHGLGRDEEALSHLDHALVLLGHGLGREHPALANTLSNRGEVLTGLHRFTEARNDFLRAQQIWEQELGPDNLNLGYALTGLGANYLAQGDPQQAIAPLERAFRIRRDHEPEPSRRAETTFALARALGESRLDRQRARRLAQAARAGYSQLGLAAKAAEIDRWLERH